MRMMFEREDIYGEKEVIPVEAQRVVLNLEDGQFEVNYRENEKYNDESAVVIPLDELAGPVVVFEPTLYVYYPDGSYIEVLDILPGELPGEIVLKVVNREYIINISNIALIRASLLSSTEHKEYFGK